MGDAVEGKEERIPVLQPRSSRQLLGGVVRGVEDAHRQGIDRGHVQRNRSLSAGGMDRSRRVVAAEEDSALRAGEDVHPRHRVLEFGVALQREREKLVQPGERDRLHPDGGDRNPPQRDLGPGDEPSEPEPAHGRLEQLVVGSELLRFAVGAKQLELAHVRPEGAGPVVVLPVDVVRDRPADGHVLGPRNDRNKEAARHEQAEDLAERHPRFAAQAARLGVEGDEPVEPGGPQQLAAVVQAGVAVTASLAIREHGADHRQREACAPVQADFSGVPGLRVAAPRLGHAAVLITRPWATAPGTRPAAACGWSPPGRGRAA